LGNSSGVWTDLVQVIDFYDSILDQGNIIAQSEFGCCLEHWIAALNEIEGVAFCSRLSADRGNCLVMRWA
jgi:hypothetical protein